MRTRLSMILAVIGAATFLALPISPASACPLRACPPQPQVGNGDGALTASYFEAQGPTGYASNAPRVPQAYHWRLRTQCQVTDPNVGGCNPGRVTCPQTPNRLLAYYTVQR